jgi:transcriptional regulator with XRE-family HTH domain
MLHRMENARRKQMAWLKAIMEETGWNQSELARRAGITHATLSKFANDPANQSELSTSTVGKIAAVSPIPHYEQTRQPMPGFDEAEASIYDGADDEDDALARAVTAIKGNSNNIQPWVLRSSAIENAGYRRGDVLVVDFSATPKAGDVVCAQIYDMQGGAETAFRIFHKPYLVASSNSARHLTPTLIDQRVDVRGVVIASLRPRLSRLAS